MIIKIANLSEGIHELFFDGKPSELGLFEPFCNSYNIELTMDKQHSQIVMNVKLSIEANFTCDRCVTDFTQLLQTNYQHVYLFGTELPDDENEAVTYLPYDADKVDISTEIFDYAQIAIPLKKICKEDCKGLCLRCGANLNMEKCECKNEQIDDRWLPLQQLKSKLPNN